MYLIRSSEEPPPLEQNQSDQQQPQQTTEEASSSTSSSCPLVIPDNVSETKSNNNNSDSESQRKPFNSLTATNDQTSKIDATDEMKRAHARQLIERYFYQLSNGCGRIDCLNKNCASNNDFETVTPNEAAARAIQLFSEDAQLCDFPTIKSARISVDAENNEEKTILATNVPSESNKLASSDDASSIEGGNLIANASR